MDGQVLPENSHISLLSIFNLVRAGSSVGVTEFSPLGNVNQWFYRLSFWHNSRQLDLAPLS